jgi:hypothetical protein
LDTFGLEKWRWKTKGMVKGAERGRFLKEAFDGAMPIHDSVAAWPLELDWPCWMKGF